MNIKVHNKYLHIKKTYSEKQHLLNSRYELLTTRQQFYGDISTLFESHCQTRIQRPESFWFDNDFEIESKYHHKTVVISSYLEFTRCCFSEYVYILLNCLLVKVFGQISPCIVTKLATQDCNIYNILIRSQTFTKSDSGIKRYILYILVTTCVQVCNN